jgi:hypothetical protein
MGFVSKAFCTIMVVCGLNVISIGMQSCTESNIEAHASFSERKFHCEHWSVHVLSSS